VRRTFLAIGVVGVWLAAVGPALATFPGANGRIAYDTASPGSLYVIHTILPSGHADKTLVPGYLPSWSPSGQRIVFTRAVNGQAEIYSMAADGDDMRRLTHSQFNDVGPSYAPGGNRILFTKTGNAVPRVMTMRRDGSDLRTLGTGVASEWSPDRKWVAFIVGRTPKHRPSIWVMRPDGTDRHRLLFLGSQGGSGPHYSPAGRNLIFTRCGGDCRAFVAKSDGSNVRPLSCSPGYFYGASAPTYSPDGRRLLGETSALQVVTLPLHSCSAKVVATGADGSIVPAWQPLPTP